MSAPARSPDRDQPAREGSRRSTRGRAARRRDRLVRSLDATGSLAVVGTLLATGVVAGAMQSSARADAEPEVVHLSVAQATSPLLAPAPRPTHTIYKTVLVTPSPKPVVAGTGSGGHTSGGGQASSSSGSSSGSSASSWKPKKSSTPVKPKPAAPAPQPKPSASTVGS